MQKIGEGYYYEVFTSSVGKVTKKLKPRWRIFAFILFANRFNIHNACKEYRQVISAIPRLGNFYRNLLRKMGDVSIVGNPVFTNEVEYIQDCAESLLNINDLDNDAFARIVHDYTALLKELWGHSISDSVFNFSINCGYVRGKLVLFDFNELTSDKESARADIRSEVWLKRSSYLRLGREKQEIFRGIMKREVTEGALESTWGSI